MSLLWKFLTRTSSHRLSDEEPLLLKSTVRSSSSPLSDEEPDAPRVHWCSWLSQLPLLMLCKSLTRPSCPPPSDEEVARPSSPPPSDDAPTRLSSPTSSPLSTKTTRIVAPNKDLLTVEVLIHAPLTVADLDAYFKGYGKICAQTIIRHGSPDYAFVNFFDPFCAQDACNESPHTIKGVYVEALPINKMVSNLSHLKFCCNPVASRRIEVKLFQYESIMKIDMKKDMFEIQVDETITEFAEEKVKSIIRKYDITFAKELQLEFYYLRVLADPETRKRLDNIVIPFYLEVSRGSESVPLKKLEDDYTICGHGLVDIEPLKCYVSPSAKYHWYWFDDNTFQPYSNNVSEHIERKFKGKEILEENIGRFSYTIDTNRMIQTNTRTSVKNGYLCTFQKVHTLLCSSVHTVYALIFSVIKY